MVRNVLIAFFLLGLSLAVNAQIEKKGTPRLMKKESVFSEGIPTYTLPSFNIEKYKQEISKDHRKKLRFARMFDLTVDIREQAKQISQKNGTLYVLSIRSKKAYSISLVFSNYNVPSGAELFIYNPDWTHIKGAFTSANNKENKALPVAPVRGEEVIIEYFEPYKSKFDGELKLAKVGHDYLDIYSYLKQKSTGVGGSGDCNVNINCEAGQGFQDVKQSVCRVVYNGWLCSGSLVNTTHFDGKPYFLTANHCISTESEAQDAVFYFNFESPECDTSYVDDYQTISVSDLIATAPDGKLDFSLLEISEPIPLNYKPYYAGWNIGTTNIENTTTIHHPSGDVKKITKDDDPPVSADYGNTYDEYSHWLIEDWEVGTTEGGSSGAPLFDQQKRIIGDLTGGEASCDHNFNDYFAKISRSWDDFGSPDHQLKHWLDPNSTHFKHIDGYYPYQNRPSNLIAVYDSIDVSLNWNPPVNESDVAYYEVFRNDSLIKEITETFFLDTTAVKDSVFFYKVRSYLDNESYTSFSDSVGVVLSDFYELPFYEYFESYDSLASGWYHYNLQGNASWEIKTGGYQNTPDTSYEGFSNAYFYETEGESARLVSPGINMKNETYVNLNFQLAMPSSQDSIDQLDVYIRYADSLPWQKIKTYNDELNSWQEINFQLPKVTQNYFLAFEATSRGGGGVYLDDLTVKKDEDAVSALDLSVSEKTICSGESVVYSIDTNDVYESYFWDFGYGAEPETVSGYGPFEVAYSYKGLKQIKLTVNENYTSYYPEMLRVHPTPSPIITLKEGALHSNYEVGNQWYFEGEIIEGADSSVYYPKENGNYLLKVTNELGCVGVSDTFKLSSQRISDIENNDIFEIFPNPAADRLYIRFHEDVNSVIYSISNIQGLTVKQGKFRATLKEFSISIKDLPPGIYFLNIQPTYNNPVRKKIIKL